MNQKKFAEALRALSLNAQFNGLITQAENFNDAAAACEEEGASDLEARIEMLEKKEEELYGPLERRISVLERKQKAILNLCTTESQRVDRLENAAHPPAPEERLFCAYCGERGHQWMNCPTHPAAASAAPSGREYPMCATHTFVTTDKCGCAKRDAPPEQARRTEAYEAWQKQYTGDWNAEPSNHMKGAWLHGYDTGSTLRPGERIVSGEGVRMHQYRSGAAVPCDGTPDQCEIALTRGTYYPDAPPRAEGE